MAILKVTGTISALGNHEVYLGGNGYSFIDFKTDSGDLRRVRLVSVMSTLDQYIRVGAKGDFYLYDIKAKKDGFGIHTLVGLKTGDIRASDMELLAAASRGLAKQKALMVIIAIILTVLGVPLMIFVIGFPLVAIAIYIWILIFRLARIDVMEIRETLRKDGFVLDAPGGG